MPFFKLIVLYSKQLNDYNYHLYFYFVNLFYFYVKNIYIISQIKGSFPLSLLSLMILNIQGANAEELIEFSSKAAATMPTIKSRP